VRLVIADDSLLVREGLARLLGDAGCEITGTAADATGLIREVHLTKPDAVVVDIKMPPTFTDEGIRAAHELRQTHPAIGILVLSQYMESEWAMRLMATPPDHLGYDQGPSRPCRSSSSSTLDRVTAGELCGRPGRSSTGSCTGPRRHPARRSDPSGLEVWP
jgi:DNA-binding NarL/FixJ family response regulator